MRSTAAYIVRRSAWESGYSDALEPGESHQGSLHETIGPRHVAVAVFRTERDATATAHRLEVEARSDRSPFWFTEHWTDLTDLSPEQAAARLVRKGFAAPPPRQYGDTADDLWGTHEAWREWWDRESVNWNEQELADAWAVFPKLRFYDVVEIELED